ncbi:MAG: GNAT family N-acetyltransferase [Pseudonocardiaceae bacterium]
MTETVEISDDVAALTDWDTLTQRCGTPIFYRTTFLSAYQAAPLQPVDGYAYLVLRAEDKSPRAVLPVTFQRRMDPLGVLEVHEPDVAKRPSGLLSHVWHCYDTWLPGGQTGSAEDLRTVLDAFRTLAADFGASWYGLVNVDGTGSLAASLSGLEAVGVPIDERYVLDLPRSGGMDAFLAQLRSKSRVELSRHRRRAQDAGIQVLVTEPRSADLDAHLALVRRTAAKHGNEGFYVDGLFQEFLRLLGDCVHIIELRLADQLIGVAICLVDEDRFHCWTGGADYAAATTFSPFYVLFYESVRTALVLGRHRFEVGRRNGVFKTRYGMRRVPLLAYLAPTGRSLVT